MKWSEISPAGYDAFYSKPECEEENREIRGALMRVVRAGDRICDFGCGTGLSKRLLGERADGKTARPAMWRGIDNDPAFVGEGNQADARSEVSTAQYDVAVFMFSAEEIGAKAVQVAIGRAWGYVLAWYRKPYLATGSWFYKRPAKYLFRYWLQSRLIYCILKADGAKITRLCGRPGYWLAEKG